MAFDNFNLYEVLAYLEFLFINKFLLISKAINNKQNFLSLRAKKLVLYFVVNIQSNIRNNI